MKLIIALFTFIICSTSFAFNFQEPYTRLNEETGTFELAKKTFIHPESGRRVELLALSHVAMPSYYEWVDKKTRTFNGKVLYELAGGPAQDVSGFDELRKKAQQYGFSLEKLLLLLSPLSFVQLASAFGLTYQKIFLYNGLYQMPHFIHADIVGNDNPSDTNDNPSDTNRKCFLDLINEQISPLAQLLYDGKIYSEKYFDCVRKCIELYQSSIKNNLEISKKLRESLLKINDHQLEPKDIERNKIALEVLKLTLIDSDALILYGALHMSKEGGFESYLQLQGFTPYAEEWFVAINAGENL